MIKDDSFAEGGGPVAATAFGSVKVDNVAELRRKSVNSPFSSSCDGLEDGAVERIVDDDLRRCAESDEASRIRFACESCCGNVRPSSSELIGSALYCSYSYSLIACPCGYSAVEERE